MMADPLPGREGVDTRITASAAQATLARAAAEINAGLGSAAAASDRTPPTAGAAGRSGTNQTSSRRPRRSS